MPIEKLEIILHERDIEQMKTEEMAVTLFTFNKEEYYLIAKVVPKEIEEDTEPGQKKEVGKDV